MDERPGWSDTQKILALIIVGAFITIVLLWMFYPPKGDPGSIAVLNTLVGAISAGFGMVLTYFFGSSKTSGMKDDTISRLTGGGGGGNGSTAIPAKEVQIDSERTTVNTETKP